MVFFCFGRFCFLLRLRSHVNHTDGRRICFVINSSAAIYLIHCIEHIRDVRWHLAIFFVGLFCIRFVLVHLLRPAVYFDKMMHFRCISTQNETTDGMCAIQEIR